MSVENDKIITKVLAMNTEELTVFMASLPPNLFAYLERILSKINDEDLKRYIA